MVSSRSARIPSLLVVCSLVIAGCSKKPAESSGEVATAAASPQAAMPAHETTTPPPAPTAAPDATPASMAPAPPASAGPARTVTGTVLETMDSGGYTYLRVDAGQDKIWAATTPTPVKVGQRFVVPLEMPMNNFHSGTLKRDFPVIYFTSRVWREGESPTAAPAASGQAAPQTPTMPPGHPPVAGGASAAPPVVTVTEVIPPPAGGHSVADVWASKAALAGKTVVVRGKVVKFLRDIMGRNWVHLQDGTGKAADGTNDLTVTTAEQTRPGEVITASGTLAVDKDFGAGYRYGAILETATLSK
jgi:hypothetical protein